MGVRDNSPESSDGDPIQRESSRVQCVAAGGAGYDFTQIQTPIALPVLGSYFGATIALGYGEKGPEYQMYREGSPRFHVSQGDAPTLIVHGDADEILPFAQAEAMERALREASVPVKLLRMPGGTHFKLRTPAAPNDLDEMTRWFGQWLQKNR
jgi:acetyl esterase/lipase